MSRYFWILLTTLSGVSQKTVGNSVETEGFGLKKFFLLRNSAKEITMPSDQISVYRDLVIAEMNKMGATHQEIALLQYETIINSIRNKRKPEDVAWAILQ